jgi:hypothetical protein
LPSILGTNAEIHPYRLFELFLRIERPDDSFGKFRVTWSCILKCQRKGSPPCTNEARTWSGHGRKPIYCDDPICIYLRDRQRQNKFYQGLAEQQPNVNSAQQAVDIDTVYWRKKKFFSRFRPILEKHECSPLPSVFSEVYFLHLLLDATFPPPHSADPVWTLMSAVDNHRQGFSSSMVPRRFSAEEMSVWNILVATISQENSWPVIIDRWEQLLKEMPRWNDGEHDEPRWNQLAKECCAILRHGLKGDVHMARPAACPSCGSNTLYVIE